MNYITFEDVYNKHLKEKKIKFKLKKDNVIYSNENVNFLKQMVRNRSFDAQMARFEQIDHHFDLISLEEKIIDQQIEGLNRYSRALEYLNERHIDRNSYERITASLEAIPYLDYHTSWDADYRKDRNNIGKGFKAFAAGIWNLIVKIINTIIQIINGGIHLVMQIIQFVSTQILKVLARKTIPKSEFEAKMEELRRNSFKKDLKTKYPMNVSQVMKVGLNAFSVFGNFTDAKSETILNHFNDLMYPKPAPSQPGQINLDFDSIFLDENTLQTRVQEESQRLYLALRGSLEKDFMVPLLTAYKDSAQAKVYKKIIETVFVNESQQVREQTATLMKFNSMDNNSLRTLGNGIAKAMFGVKDKAESIDVYEFFRNNAQFITDTADTALKKFIDMCKNSTKKYKELNKAMNEVIKKRADDIIGLSPIAQKILVASTKELIAPFTRIMCGMINWTRRGFVLEFYKLKLLMLNLWKKASFGAYSDDELVEEPEPLGLPPGSSLGDE